MSQVEALMQKMNASALEVAAAFGAILDYSDHSVSQVEEILGEMHDEFLKTRDEEGLRGIALFFAAYIGEVIRRKGLGGTWNRNHPDFGEDSFPFTWNGGVLFLNSWCLKRIFDGKEDDVWFKFQALVLEKLTGA